MIRFENVHKSFDSQKVLNGVSFDVVEGEVLAVVGPSGTGKSVLLKHIVGLIEPDEGSVVVKEGAQIGYLFQSGALLAWLTVRENVALPLRETTRLSESEIEKFVDEALDAVLYDEPTSGLDSVTARNIHKLIREVNTRRKLTSIVVTHDLFGACSFADRILMLKGGKVVFVAPPKEFLQSDVPDVQDLVSASRGEI